MEQEGQVIVTTEEGAEGNKEEMCCVEESDNEIVLVKLREDTLCGEKETSKNVSDKVAFKTEVEKVDIAKHMPTIVDPKRS